MKTTSNITTVNPSNYEVYEFIDGYFGIIKIGQTQECIFGGDSANEDDYNKEYITSVYNQWDGKLIDNRIENN